MTLDLSTPDPGDPRSVYADWMEYQALTQPTGRASMATLENVLDFTLDVAEEPEEIFDTEARELLDNDILEDTRSDLMQATFEELEYRQSILGDSYPFRMGSDGKFLERIANESDMHAGRSIYIFCLLVSLVRKGRLLTPGNLLTAIEAATKSIAETFQVCACLAAGGYIGGEVASFGFPRAEGTAFLPALRQAYERFGHLTVPQDNPEGFTRAEAAKDGGIDVIAWRDHPDRKPGKLYLLGQCASGKNWKHKSVLEYVNVFHGTWFYRHPAQHWLPAMFIPFALHDEMDELDENASVGFYDSVRNRFFEDEMRYGIVFDRFRIAHYANMCLTFESSHRAKVDGNDRVDQIDAWVETVVNMSTDPKKP